MKILVNVYRERQELSQFSYGKDASTLVTDLALSNGINRVGFPSLLSTRRRRHPLVGFKPETKEMSKISAEVGYSAPSSELFKVGSFKRIPVATCCWVVRPQTRQPLKPQTERSACWSVVKSSSESLITNSAHLVCKSRSPWRAS
jgi:hypothetical protein